MSPADPRFSEEEARALWRRAAELHVAAERARAAGHDLARVDPSALSFADVAAAAEGAGIDPDYVRIAVAEQRLPDADEIRREKWVARWTRRVIAEPDALEVSRVIRATPERVAAALNTVATRAPFGMVLESRLGDDPAQDGVLVYRMTDSSSSTFGSPMDFADARVVIATVRPAGEGARLLVRAPLFRRGINLLLSSFSGGLLGTGGGYAGAAAGSGLAALLGSASLALIAAPIGVGVVAGGALGVSGYRSMYRAICRKAVVALQGLLGAVALEVEGADGRSVGGPTQPPAPLPPGPEPA